MTLAKMHMWTNSALTARYLFVFFSLLTLLYVFRPSFIFAPRYDSLVEWKMPPKGRDAIPRIAKVSMLYGEKVNPLYERAVRTHKEHNDRYNYPFYILRHETMGGYWNKPSYLLSLVVQELAKPPSERLEWLMWVDADLCLVNPALPLSIFLPPTMLPFEVHFLGNKDQNGLNTGTFFLRISQWSVRMLTKAMAYPMYWPSTDLGVSMDQVAMAYIFNETEFNGNGQIMYQPRQWYNTYEFHHGYEGQPGDLLVHFPGLEQDRWSHMEEWLDRLERKQADWTVEVEKTKYPDELALFWNEVTEGRKTLLESEMWMQEEMEGEVPSQVKEAIDTLRHTVTHETDLKGAVIAQADRVKFLVESVRGRPPSS